MEGGQVGAIGPEQALQFAVELLRVDAAGPPDDLAAQSAL